jgi:hypothetical protein
VFCFAGVGCSALRHCTGHAHTSNENKTPPCCGILCFLKNNNEKIAEQFLPFFIVALCLFSSCLENSTKKRYYESHTTMTANNTNY